MVDGSGFLIGRAGTRLLIGLWFSASDWLSRILGSDWSLTGHVTPAQGGRGGGPGVGTTGCTQCTLASVGGGSHGRAENTAVLKTFTKFDSFFPLIFFLKFFLDALNVSTDLIYNRQKQKNCSIHISCIFMCLALDMNQKPE